MAKLTRKTLIPFGNSGPTSAFGQFGSKEAGSPQTSQDPTVIQQLSAWVEGWQNAVVNSDKAAYIEDMNGIFLVHSYMSAYLFQEGIPEWDAGTTYFTGSVVQDNASGGQWFKSLQDNNLNNTLPAGASNAFWRWVNPPQMVVGSATLNKIPKVTAASAPNGVPGSAVYGNSALSDDAANNNIVLGNPAAPGSASPTYGIQFGDGTVQTTAATNPNVATTQSPPSAYPNGGGVSPFTRVLGTVYQNTSAKPRFVSASVGVTGSNAFAYTDTNPSPVQIVVQVTAVSGADTIYAQLFFIVLPGYYYKVTGGTLTYWTEWS